MEIIKTETRNGLTYKYLAEIDQYESPYDSGYYGQYTSNPDYRNCYVIDREKFHGYLERNTLPYWQSANYGNDFSVANYRESAEYIRYYRRDYERCEKINEGEIWNEIRKIEVWTDDSYEESFKVTESECLAFESDSDWSEIEHDIEARAMAILAENLMNFINQSIAYGASQAYGLA